MSAIMIFDTETTSLEKPFCYNVGYTIRDAETFAELVSKYKVQTDEEKKKVIAAGGLCVIGTERHDSRRIDDQLRGRAGRQGDPGVSVFYVSAEDDMVRIFSGDLMKRAMAFLRVDDDTPMQAKLLSRAIESAQKKIEGIHFSSRKHVLQYDDVNNQQRKVIYRERNRVLDGEDVHQEILDMSHDYARHALEEACDAELNTEKWNFAEVNKRLKVYFPVEEDILNPDNSFTAQDACDFLEGKCRELIEQRTAQMDEDEVPSREAERFILLRTTDKLWMDHIDALDDLRKGVGLQAIGQHDPLLVYKKEAYDMFEKLNEQIKVQTIRLLLYGKIVRTVNVQAQQPQGEINPNKNRNGPCPCGSGKKYKDCCLKKDLEKQKTISSTPTQAEGERELTKQERYAQIREQRKLNKQNKK